MEMAAITTAISRARVEGWLERSVHIPELVFTDHPFMMCNGRHICADTVTAPRAHVYASPRASFRRNRDVIKSLTSREVEQRWICYLWACYTGPGIRPREAPPPGARVVSNPPVQSILSHVLLSGK